MRTLLAVAITLLTLATPVRADDDGAAGKLRVRFADAVTLEDAQRWADALERFEAILRDRRTPEVAFHRALCLEHLGRLLGAQRAYKDLLAEGPPARVAREIEAHLADLTLRLPRVVLAASGDARGVVFSVDDQPVRPGRALRLDPGPHVAIARREGRVVAAAAFSAVEHRVKIIPLGIR